MDNQNNAPYHFDSNTCKTCGGKCCRGFGGYVWISMEELEKMAGARKMDVALFSKQYVRQVQGRLSLQERVINGEHFCCFFDLIDCQCAIYQSRPKQCRTFPFWDHLKKDPQKLLDECPGVSLPIDFKLPKSPAPVTG
ncbi:MAG: YkgJ family cysteine cluster protein [Deltaproteobacteria bacterium]|nr:YkgJ family cysteine cluster protein [Deltaproteobacteria bacterium]